MRYEKGHKEETRQRIVEIAAREFRRNGINGIGVADVMAQAGLTHGGFYSHFASKEELVCAALDEAGRTSRTRKAAEEGKSLEEILRGYLRSEHRDHPERGCAIACLVAEVGRGSKVARVHLTAHVNRVLELIEARLPEGRETAEERKKRAMAVFSTAIGSLQLSRAVTDPVLSDQLIEAGLRGALALARLQTKP